MKTFLLPDLGEGLPEAEIVTWHVAVGDRVRADDPLVSVETAKAVVDVPAPFSGEIVRLHADAGEFVNTGAPLVDFELTDATAAAPDAANASGKDAATVVGTMPVGKTLLVERAVAGPARKRSPTRPRATPAVRALARRLGVDIETVSPTGAGGQITSRDVEAAARGPSNTVPTEPGWEQLHGLRRTMAQTMTHARDEVCHASVFDDADIDDWQEDQDITVRLIRAICRGIEAEPALNAHFDGATHRRRLLPTVDIGIAVDTPRGLIVPVLRDVRTDATDQWRERLSELKQAAAERRLTPEQLSGAGITLSNFGMLAGRYARVVVVPPAVAIVGAGGIRKDAVACNDSVTARRRLPLSLSFDHRCVTGGEACRFLAALITDLTHRN